MAATLSSGELTIQMNIFVTSYQFGERKGPPEMFTQKQMKAQVKPVPNPECKKSSSPSKIVTLQINDPNTACQELIS